jgi:uncharacterized protein YodC (DUF2158 family)
MEPFKTGNIVKLKVGGPKMTVFKVTETKDPTIYSVTCHWFDKNDILYEHNFSSLELE